MATASRAGSTTTVGTGPGGTGGGGALGNGHGHGGGAQRPRSDNYKWLALSNTTVGIMLATIDSSIMLIAMPDIFRGIKLDPLAPAQQLLSAVDDPWAI